MHLRPEERYEREVYFQTFEKRDRSCPKLPRSRQKYAVFGVLIRDPQIFRGCFTARVVLSTVNQVRGQDRQVFA